MTDIREELKTDSLDLILRTLQFEDVERPPLYDLPHNDAMIEHYGAGDVLKAIDNSLDMTRNIRFPQEERVVEQDGFVWQYDRWTEWIRSRPFSGMDEVEAFVRRETGRIRDQDPGELEQSVRKSVEEHIEQQKQFSRTHKILVAPGPGLGSSYHALGMESFALLCHDEPQLVSEWLEAKTEQALKAIGFTEEPDRLSPLVFVGEDIAHGGGPIFSPAFLEREFFPRLKRVIDALHARGLMVMFHSDGNLFPVLDDLQQCGIDGLNPLEDMDLSELRRRCPDLFLAGGIDCSHLLAFGSPEEVGRAVQKAIKAAGPGYFPGSTSEIHPNIPLANIRAMIETCRKAAS